MMHPKEEKILLRKAHKAKSEFGPRERRSCVLWGERNFKTADARENMMWKTVVNFHWRKTIWFWMERVIKRKTTNCDPLHAIFHSLFSLSFWAVGKTSNYDEWPCPTLSLPPSWFCVHMAQLAWSLLVAWEENVAISVVEFSLLEPMIWKYLLARGIYRDEIACLIEGKQSHLVRK